MPTLVIRRTHYYATEVVDGYQWIVRQQADNPLSFAWNVLCIDRHCGYGGFAPTKEAAHQRVAETIASEKKKVASGHGTA